MKITLRYAIVFTLLAAACRQAGKVDLHEGGMGSRVHQSAPIGVGATLQLLEDPRIDSSLRTGFQRGLPDDACVDPGTERWKAFCADVRAAPLRPARLSVVDKDGATRASMTLERPIAELIVIDSLTSGHRWYGISVDLSAELGSYSGPLLRLLDAQQDHLAWARAADEHGRDEDIGLPTTLKTAWRFSNRESGSARDILLVACRPDLSGQSAKDTAAFLITYTRFAYKGDGWHRQSRTVPGFWENEGDFPPQSLFPR
jgi:hypothetical protein